MLGPNHKLIFNNQAFQLGMTLPANTSAVATNALRAGGARGLLAITITAANAAVALAITKKLTVSLQVGATETGSFAAPKHNPTLVVTMAAAYAPAQNDVITTMVVPMGLISGDNTAAKWVKAVVATDDAAAAGLINVFMEYLAH